MENRVLLVDDEPKILAMLEAYFSAEGFKIKSATDGSQALQLFKEFAPQAVILDVMMPGLNGLDVCREIRKSSKVPIIMLTARAEEIDKLLGLELGADDYVTKPFSLKELGARLRAVLRRTSQYQETPEEEQLVRGELVINLAKREVRNNGEQVTLTPTEYNILYILAKHTGRPYSRLQLLDMALDESYQGYDRVIDTHISNLRKKVERDPSNPRYIQTVYGIGYKFGEEV